MSLQARAATRCCMLQRADAALSRMTSHDVHHRASCAQRGDRAPAARAAAHGRLDGAAPGELFRRRRSLRTVGIVGLDLSPPHALLRSLAVDEHARTHGVGAQLLAHAEQYAWSRGVRSLYLLTTTAEPFFAARGYVRVDREQAPAFIRSSTEFSALCPESAAFMLKRL